jgi:ribose transport system substrate-binding protein
MPQTTPNEDPYLVRAFQQACQVMAAFHRADEPLRLRDIVSRTGLPKGTVFRLLYTLHKEGWVEKAGPHEYCRHVSLPRKSKYRLGYAANSKDGFTRVVTEGLMQAAEHSAIELMILDNHDDSSITLRNAEWLIREKPDLVIEFQGDQSIADALSTRFMRAQIPMMAVDVPHPGAVYFGANNYRAGMIAGRYMGRWANLHWQPAPSELVLIGYNRAGPILLSRIKGMLAGFSDTWDRQSCSVVHLDSIGDYDSALEAMRSYLHRTVPRQTLVGAVNDPAALAALQAFAEAGRAQLCAVMGQNAEPEARAELRRPGTQLLGSVAYFPEKYGRGIIALAQRILSGFQGPPAMFTKHVLVTAENVDHVYPNDLLIVQPATERNSRPN